MLSLTQKILDVSDRINFVHNMPLNFRSPYISSMTMCSLRCNWNSAPHAWHWWINCSKPKRPVWHWIKQNFNNLSSHTHTYIHTHTHTHTYTHTHIHTYTHTHTHTTHHTPRTHTHTHTRTHARTHARTHTHAYIHTHTLFLSPLQQPSA